MSPKPLKFAGLTKPKPINLLIPGLGEALGRTGPHADRLRVSSGTREPQRYRETQAMFRDLGRRMLFEAIRARMERRFDTETLFLAYRKGEAGLRGLLEHHTGRRVWPLYQQFRKEYRKRDRVRTLARIERFLEVHGGKDATTEALTASKVAAFLADLADQRATLHENATSGATRNRYRSAIGVFATWMVRRGHLTRHPIAFKAVPKDEESEPRLPAPFTPDEYRQYFDALLGERPDFAIVFRLLIHTGADMDEVLTRTVRDVDFNRGVVHYKRTKTRTPKRLVPFPEFIAPDLRGHIAAWGLKPADSLFGMFVRRTLETTHAHAARAIARPELRIKDLRHLAAIAWVQAGVPITVVKDYLGHATLSQTMVYAAFQPSDQTHQRHGEMAAEVLRGPAGVIPMRKTEVQ